VSSIEKVESEGEKLDARDEPTRSGAGGQHHSERRVTRPVFTLRRDAQGRWWVCD